MKAVEFTQQLLADLTDSSLIGVDLEGRDVVRVAAMPKTAIYHSQVSRGAGSDGGVDSVQAGAGDQG